MIRILRGDKVAIVGGGRFCKEFLTLLLGSDFHRQRPVVVGVADPNPRAPGIGFARSHGIATFDDYGDFFAIQNLDVIIELTQNDLLAEEIRSRKPYTLHVIDHFEATAIWTDLRIEQEYRASLDRLRRHLGENHAVEAIFDRFASRITRMVRETSEYALGIDHDLVEHQLTLNQIIEGSTIPTFVINRDHIVTHWNKALEKLSGCLAAQVVGTNRQWAPFWDKARPSMADVILAEVPEGEIQRLYGEQWRKSALIEDAYEAEVFFPSLGDAGKWCFFTAAPIRGPDGTLLGAIETLWDKTEDKRSEEERERHTLELSTLCAIYTALSAATDIDSRIETAVDEVRVFIDAESVCIFIDAGDNCFQLAYRFGLDDPDFDRGWVPEKESILHAVAHSGRFAAIGELPENCSDAVCRFDPPETQSLAYIPISTKDKKTFGLIRLGSRLPRDVLDSEREVLELIGNRIGVAMENAALQDQVIKSEEKYRTLFNNDPHPIFILDTATCRILDINQRAQESYGYGHEELLGIPFLNLGDPADPELAVGFEHLTRGQSLLFTQRRHFRKGGTPFYVDINISLAAYGETDVVIASTTDITESVKKETQLIQASKMTTLGLMAAGIAHEINQPLNVIQVCADYLHKTIRKGVAVTGAELASVARDIAANVQRATGIIGHMRDFARQSEVVRRRININDPIGDVFKVLGSQVKVHRIDLTLDLDPLIPEILAEHNRLEQVFINLVINAIDAMDDRSLAADAKTYRKRLAIRSFAENGWVVVSVTDNGVGMSEAVVNQIFEPFFTTKAVGRGTGLGVSISYGIVRDYDGSIHITSRLGEGTTFEVRFPAVQG
ncbi:MAG: PAS domain S-box protein [Desulfobacterales bacterium]|nr:PAS domain S-box protein [Desulfobacterales bacterium]